MGGILLRLTVWTGPGKRGKRRGSRSRCFLPVLVCPGLSWPRPIRGPRPRPRLPRPGHCKRGKRRGLVTGYPPSLRNTQKGTSVTELYLAFPTSLPYFKILTFFDLPCSQRTSPYLPNHSAKCGNHHHPIEPFGALSCQYFFSPFSSY